MTPEVKHVSFSLTKREIKALNKYRKEHKDEDLFEFKLKPTGIGVVVEVRPKRLPTQPQEPWENLTDYGSW